MSRIRHIPHTLDRWYTSPRPPRTPRTPRTGLIQPGSQRPSPRGGYTLIELLVVIAIIIVSLGIIIPSVNKFVEMAMDGTAKNGLNTALISIRAYATRDKKFISHGNYSGVAIIVTPADELRLVENTEYVLDTTSAFLEDSSLDGYIDIEDRDYITIPKDTGIVGINAPSGSNQYVAPPFAIRFDQNGQLALTNSSDNTTYVYYDGNYDGLINTGTDRTNLLDGSSTYVENEWDPWDPNHVAANGKYEPTNTDDINYGKYKLPFEKMEAVIGVIIYSKRTLRENGGTWSNGYQVGGTLTGCGDQHDQSCSNFNDWLKYNGQVLFFSRYTGALLQHK